MTSSELDAEFPGAVPWAIRHPFVLFAIEFGVILVMVVAIVAAIDGLRGR